ncbi:MAG: ribonuclease Y, partial [Victivallaceae bacterium]|nr:ribonuclease Y [Victivallaceae bacterium]
VETRLAQRGEMLDRRTESIDAKGKTIEKQEHEIEVLRERLTNREQELDKSISRQIDELERIAGMNRDEARDILLEKLKNEVKNESGILVRNILDEAKARSEREARRMLTYAIQRYASDCTYERTTATIPLPNDEMKGRIIGREGRNIRAIEAATGVNILIDDTPEAVVISCFDPVRKEIARQLMEKLIVDGRIHPTRIEELAKKIGKDLEEEMFQVGEAAVLETGIQGVPPQIVKLLGRLKYRYSFSQNVLQHSLEASYFMGMIAAEMGLDEQKAKRIGLFHDLGKAIDHEVEGPHAQIGADMLRKFNEAKDVVHAVAAHHGEVEPESLYDVLISACDTLSASRPGARSETTELYLKRLEQLEAIAHEFSGVESCFALQAGREVRVVVTPEKITEGEAQMLARDICAKIEKEMTYPGQIKVTIIRETRSVEYAK